MKSAFALATRDLPATLARAAGEWLVAYQRLIRRLQWGLVGLYLVLVAVPAFLPLPDRTAHLWSNVTLFAQFAFWGIWWPFVLLSMVLVGRAWCGLFCPEGALTEAVSRHGLGRAVPRWLTWAGWPFVAFACTTVYGQLVSVYQYPKPVLVILGGSTLAAMAVGYLYGRNKRVWCRYLCPVNGVFGLLAKLAPVHFRVDQEAWRRSQAIHPRLPVVDCAPLVPLRTMRGASQCHMCGRCEGFRGAIELAPRAPNHEIVQVAGDRPSGWDTALIAFGLMGIASGAFHWTTSPWYIDAKQSIAEWLVEHGAAWPLETSAPWWLLTHYPDRNDVLTLLDGAVLLGYIGVTAGLIGGAVHAALAVATLSLGRFETRRFHHLAQALIPIAGGGVFLGLSALTASMLKAEQVELPWLDVARALVLGGAALWSVWLGWGVAGRYSASLARRGAATLSVGAAVAVGVASWVIFFWVW